MPFGLKNIVFLFQCLPFLLFFWVGFLLTTCLQVNLTRINILYPQHFFSWYTYAFIIYNNHKNNCLFGLLRPLNSFFFFLFSFNRLLCAFFFATLSQNKKNKKTCFWVSVCSRFYVCRLFWVGFLMPALYIIRRERLVEWCIERMWRVTEGEVDQRDNGWMESTLLMEKSIANHSGNKRVRRR